VARSRPARELLRCEGLKARPKCKVYVAMYEKVNMQPALYALRTEQLCTQALPNDRLKNIYFTLLNFINMADVMSVGGRRYKSVFEIGMLPFGTFVASLPLFGFVTCIALSLLYDFESSTATHCGVSRL